MSCAHGLAHPQSEVRIGASQHGNYYRFSREPEEDPLKHDPADSLTCSEFRAWLRLEQ